ncbi:MAG: Tat pathway signal sequence domain protein [Chloroflexi bacterium]|nr:Tat pathway signal sequence domain protein [Chloroflexota bacterium]
MKEEEALRQIRLTRRRLLQGGAAAAGVIGAEVAGLLAPAGAVAASPRGTARQVVGPVGEASIDRAYSFLDFMMDAYQQGTTTRLTQSYSDQQGLQSTAFVYDNALQILAYVPSTRSAVRLARARVLGDSLLYAQQHDPVYHDGRLRDAYFVAPSFVQPDGTVQLAGAPFYFYGSAVGNMAWAGLALVRLYALTRNGPYLDGAERLGAWIVANAYDTRGAGGYTGGVDAGNNKLMYKATEHNIDVYAFFTILAGLTGNATYTGLSQSWSQLARHALTFVQAMWNPDGGFFWTGTGNDGATINKSVIPEDVQTWSYLAMRDNAYARSIDWATSNLAVTDTPQSINSSLSGNQSFSGVTFSNASKHPVPPSFSYAPVDPDGVWFEGTGHAADALLYRNAPASGGVFRIDRQLASYYLGNIELAQEQLGKGQTVGGKQIPAGTGIQASSSPLDTGFGYGYFPHLHIGATSWYILAALGSNPFA